MPHLFFCSPSHWEAVWSERQWYLLQTYLKNCILFSTQQTHNIIAEELTRKTSVLQLSCSTCSSAVFEKIATQNWL